MLENTNLKNLPENIVNDKSEDKIFYYFDGKCHPFVQIASNP